MDLYFKKRVIFSGVNNVYKNTKIGSPYLKDVEVKAEVLRHHRGPKTIAYQYRKRKDSARTVGHREDLTAVRIAKISA